MKLIPILALSLVGGQAFATDDIQYDLSFDNAAHHEALISATFNNVKNGTLEPVMSRSSPGRYALHEFAKNVYRVSAKDSKGNALKITRPNPYQWNIEKHDGTVTVTYTLFADRAGGTYSQVDRTHAHLNIPATFMWAKGYEDRKIRVNFKPFSDDWKVATQLEKTAQPYSFTAPNLAYFLDSPTELSNHDLRSWSVPSGGKDYTIKLAVHHDGTAGDMDEYTKRAKAIIDEQVKVFGELPDFDYGEYVFIACYLPHISGDGMEHRNSTILTTNTSLDENEFKQQGTLSHEFIHAWNVERIRPKDLEPFNFTNANMTKNLWFAEGFTKYYGDLTIRRAKHASIEDYLKVVSATVNQANFAAGRNYFSPEGASMMATFTDASTSIDPTNFRNIFFSYYSYGRVMAMALDLSIRDEFQGKTLDGYMALMWRKFGKPEIPYTRDDLRSTLGEYLGNKAFADTFFDTYIVNKNTPDFAKLLKSAGLEVTTPKADKPYVGPISLKFKGEAANISSSIKVGSPLYASGLERGDTIVALGRRSIRSQELWDKALEQFTVGETTTIKYLSRGQEYSTDITFTPNPKLEVVKLPDEKTSEQQEAFLAAWIGTE